VQTRAQSIELGQVVLGLGQVEIRIGRAARETVAELIGHYVNYRKAFAPNAPHAHFGLYAVSTRRPQGLAGLIDPVAVKPGVYRLPILSRTVTLIVPREVEPVPRNALWELFSFESAKVVQGAADYRWRQNDHIPILAEIQRRYRELGIPMSYTFQDFYRDYVRERLNEMTPEERLRGLSVEDRLRGLAPDERLRGLAPDERLRGLAPDERLRGLSPDERLRGLAPEQRLLGLSEEELIRLKDLLDRRTSGQG
jgi:hypothetical protein